MALVFYDTETTGTETFFDQILQFAAIRTDEDLREIERYEVRCRLLPHVVPSPEAMSITGISVSQLNNPSFPSHYEMVRSIFTKFNSWSPALYAGWNSIDFDESIIRQAFYKTLHNPYLTSRVGNSRSDVMRIVQACSLFAPEALVFPVNEKGDKTFKLGSVAIANGFKNDRSHDAMSDVEATIYLCRLLVEKAPNVWSSFMSFSKKAAVVDYIGDQIVFSITAFYYGKPYSHLVTTIGQNEKNKAEWYLYDLSVDPCEIESLNDEELAIRLREMPKPIKRLKSNAAPMIFSAEDAPEICRARQWSMEELEQRAQILREDDSFCRRLISTYESLNEPFPPSPHVEKQIYDSFFERSDEALMDDFHRSAWENRFAITERFKDSRLRTIGRNLIHIERPDVLHPSLRQEHDIAIAKRMLGLCEEVDWLTLPQALDQLNQKKITAFGSHLEHIREHEGFLIERHDVALMINSDS